MVITNNILIKGSVYLHVKGTLFEGYEMKKILDQDPRKARSVSAV